MAIKITEGALKAIKKRMLNKVLEDLYEIVAGNTHFLTHEEWLKGLKDCEVSYDDKTISLNYRGIKAKITVELQ